MSHNTIELSALPPTDQSNSSKSSAKGKGKAPESRAQSPEARPSDTMCYSQAEPPAPGSSSGTPSALHSKVRHLSPTDLLEIVTKIKASKSDTEIQLHVSTSQKGPIPWNSTLPIVILALVNAVVSGILALIHDAGATDRYRSYSTAFDELQDYVRQIIDTTQVPAGTTNGEVVAEIYGRYRVAKDTVANNKEFKNVIDHLFAQLKLTPTLSLPR